MSCLYTMDFLPQDDIIRTLLGARGRLNAGFYVVLHDVHAAEDVFQEVMVKALAQVDLFTNEAQLLSWARAVGRNAGLNLMRKLSRVSVGLPAVLLDVMEQESEADACRGREEALAQCLEKLPPAARELLELRYFHALPCKEVALRTGFGVEAVYQKLSRLHRTLRDCVDRTLNLHSEPS